MLPSYMCPSQGQRSPQLYISIDHRNFVSAKVYDHLNCLSIKVKDYFTLCQPRLKIDTKK